MSTDPSDVPDDDPSLEDAITYVFKDWHGKTVRPWEVDACKEVIQRHLEPSPTSKLRPLLLVRSTGGGKSAVRDVSGFLCGGITITVVPLLSLAANQTSKLEQLSLDNQLFNRFHVFNLDIIRSASLNEQLRHYLEQLPNDESCTTTVTNYRHFVSQWHPTLPCRRRVPSVCGPWHGIQRGVLPSP